MSKKLRVVFMGTPEFAVPCLEKLNEITDVVLVVTQPDRKRGRGQKVTFSPVKEYATSHGLPVYQPEKIKNTEAVEYVRRFHPDLIVVVAFGQILSTAVLDIPPLGCVNVHASLLPRWRGAAPIHWSIISGDKVTGVTTMYMDAGLDTGDMIFKTEVPITPEMTTAELHDILAKQGANLLQKTVLAIMKGEAPRQKQEGDSTYAKMLHEQDCEIDWQAKANDIHNLVRGLNSWPVARGILQGKKVRFFRTRVLEGRGEPGQIVRADKNGIVVGTGEGLLSILELQLENKKRMSAAAFLNGHKLTK